MRTIILKSLACVALASSLSACSDDYLKTSPTDENTSEKIYSTSEGLKYGINGIAYLMCRQCTFTSNGVQSIVTSGEDKIKYNHGNEMGNNFVVFNKNAFATVYAGARMASADNVYCYVPWQYYYKIISNANDFLTTTEKITYSSEKEFCRAQALTFRAYSFFMLSQIYSKRWIDSNNGASRGVILRTDSFNIENQPAATLAETYDRVYKDLNRAISIFKSSNITRDKSEFWLPDLTVAQAILARVAITRQDYATAKKMADAVIANSELMSNDEYASGFNQNNAEWIWGSEQTQAQNMGQYSMFYQFSYNGTGYVNSPAGISRELLDQIPNTDVRKSLYLDPNYPDSIKTFVQTTTSTSFGKDTEDLSKKAKQQYPDVYGAIYAYMQFKFKGLGEKGWYGSSCHIRAAEMYYISAEADYFLGNENGARASLIKVTKDTGRDPEYNCTKSGAELLKEIKKYRAFDLWGEGFDWFDMKRWGEPIVHKSYTDGGNYYASMLFTIKPQDNNGWTWAYPENETDYNTAVTTFE